MNSNWFKIFMKLNKVKYGKKLMLKGRPVIFNKKGATLKIGNNVLIKSSFMSNLVGLYSRTIIVTRCKDAKIIIGKNCFIGCNAIILKGTILGDGCIVGAGAVVSGVFEDNSVIVGNPAKVIKEVDSNEGTSN